MENYWYEENPVLLQSEIDTLKNGLKNFIFHSEKSRQNGTIIIEGELIFGDNRRQVVHVLFRSSYPFSPPEVYPLKKVALPINGQLMEVLSPMPFNRGNQYTNNKMCLFDDEKTWIPYVHGVELVIFQAQKWMETATSQEGFTDDSKVIENIPELQHSGQLLAYLPNTLTLGTTGTLLIKKFNDNNYCLLQIIGESLAVQTFPNNTTLSSPKHNTIVGRWFLKEDITVKEALNILNQGETLRIFLLTHFKENLVDLIPNATADVKTIILGFFLGERHEFHSFQLLYWSQGENTTFVAKYLLTKNLNTELFARIDSMFKLNDLMAKKVLIVGLGAIGSKVACELASSSIGNFVLIDHENFEAGNSIRHAGDLQSVGYAKVEILKKMILSINPMSKVDSIQSDILIHPKDNLISIIKSCDLVLDLTANRLVENYLHSIISKLGITYVIAASSFAALTGNVIVIKPSITACLDCLKAKGFDRVPISSLNINKLPEVSPELGQCSKPAFPGNSIDTGEIALQTARVALQLLSQNSDSFYPNNKGSQYYWYGPAGGISPISKRKKSPFTWECANILCDNSCENYKKHDS